MNTHTDTPRTRHDRPEKKLFSMQSQLFCFVVAALVHWSSAQPAPSVLAFGSGYVPEMCSGVQCLVDAFIAGTR